MPDGHYLPALSPLPCSRFCVARQHMLSALVELFATSSDEADDEAGATVRAIMQIAILLRTPVMSSAGGTLGAGGRP
jgi:hypothetical protein